MGCGCGKKAAPVVTAAVDPVIPTTDPNGEWEVTAATGSRYRFGSLSDARIASEAVGGRISGI